VGVVVSKKVGIAVIRNRVRRRLREALRGLIDSLDAPQAKRHGVPSLDLIVIVRPEASQASFLSLRQALVRALNRGGLV
jgi:ribonuclease P protein component